MAGESALRRIALVYLMQNMFRNLVRKTANDKAFRSEARPQTVVYGAHTPIKCTEVTFKWLDSYESLSLRALIMWVAVNKNVSEGEVMDRLASTFGLGTVSDLKAEDTQAAKNFILSEYRTGTR